MNHTAQPPAVLHERPSMRRSAGRTFRGKAAKGLAACVVAGLAACATKPDAASSNATVGSSQSDVAAYRAMIVDARALIDRKEPLDAITKDLDPIIAAYDRKYGNSRIAYYSPRTLPETLLYMATSAISPGAGVRDKPGGPNAIALDQTWSAALYLKGFALVDLHRPAEARPALERAVRLAPSDSQYLSELGQWYETNRNWPKALEYFTRAERGAEVSPPDVKTHELTRALRGMAFVDVELGKLDDAEALYLRCLSLDAQDARAARELEYVRSQQRAKAATPTSR